MTRFELTIPVKQAGQQAAGAFYVLWALVGAAASYLIFAGAGSILGIPKQFGGYLLLAQFLIGIVGGLIYVYVPYRVAMTRAEGAAILLNEDGIGLPPSLFGVGSSRWVPWGELKAVKLGLKSCRPSHVILESRGRRDAVALDAVSHNDMEQLLLAIEAWAPSAVWSTAVQTLRDGLQAENYGSEGFSHTQLFEDELAKRFSAPTFVPLAPGLQLRSGTLQIVRQLAFGGFSAIYLADDSIQGRVVVKESVIPSNCSPAIRDKATELFAREAKLLSSLNHEGIASVHDFFIEAGRSYIVLEYVDGLNMRQLVTQRGPQSERLVLDWASQVADVLIYLHSQSTPVVHRDITPDNLVLTNLGKVVVIDFGASNQYLANVTGTLVGKHAYMPPEQIRGRAEPASDIYALGATMQFLLTGSEPEPLAPCHPRSNNSDVSIVVDELVARATDLEVEQRIRSACQMKSTLKEALALSNRKGSTHWLIGHTS